ncbi:hypothetical protein SAMN05216326_12521 [Nitrosomonas marina]|uniref:Uncharacterized protein n=1 Tax=Nitrosomonas marina TaxID=917 RepID=A0A1I0E6A3_9PROT|nr:hypothetical protein [Nitrosomonas marina]SET40446.1 hypothetical protein SAMN05216326_12521 [Nitrosomonas marina]
MHIDNHHKVTIELHDGDIKIMREIMRLAHMQLNNSPITYLRGILVPSQCGLIGSDLIHTKQMIEEIGREAGVELSFDVDVADQQQVSSTAVTKV